jgi:hypothetical protein
MHATDTAARFDGFEPAVARQDGAGLVDQDRVGPDPLDALHQAGDLAFRMLPEIAGKLLQVPNRTPDNPFRQAGLALLCIGEIADLVCKLRVRSFTPRSNQLAKPRRGAKNAGTMGELFVCRYLSFVAICRELNSRQIPTQLYVPYGRYRERRRIPRQGPFPACCSIPPRYVDLAECRSS